VLKPFEKTPGNISDITYYTSNVVVVKRCDDIIGSEG